MTFRQALELGGHVRKGETGSMVVYANRVAKTETDGNGDEVEREIAFLKAYTVFCVDQIDGLPSRYYAAISPSSRPTPAQAGRTRRRLCRRDRRSGPQRRKPGLLQPDGRPHRHAGLHELP